MRAPHSLPIIIATACVLAVASRAGAAESLRGSEIHITRAQGPIVVDGDLSDPGWHGATRVDTWFEAKPGDNVPPKVKSVGWVTYDDRYLYAGFEFSDPDPSRIRAMYGDRDDISDALDFGGIILDTRNDGRTGLEFLASPRGVQFDAINDDTTGNENASPDFYWDSAGKITKDGWNLEIRIPFSSLRYTGGGPQTWGIMLYRNYPRDFRYMIFSMRLPQGSSCFVCRSNVLTGLDGLPSATHLVAAPYVSAKQEALPAGDPGTRLVAGPTHTTGGLDAKWLPDPDHAFDLAINPDFSQVESDVAQISANERFALLYPETRPFFLEGSELFSTPVQAVYTRAITSPRWGLRATGKLDSTAYTVLVADDRGGGSAIIPGPDFSSFADQDFSSRVAVARLRHDIGRSFVSVLLTDREISGGGYNRVFGPDFQWRPSGKDTVTGQILASVSETPNRPDLATEWDGRKLSGGGADASWWHSTRTFDSGVELKAFGEGFRADAGFVPQVGFRESYGEVGYSWYPTGFLSRVRAFALTDPMWDNEGRGMRNLVAGGVTLEGRWNLSSKFWVYADRWRVGQEGADPATFRQIPQTQFRFYVQLSPSQYFSSLYLEGILGEQIDFANARPGRGATLILEAGFRPTDHLS
ncbi:MAG: carbohydrate binding family 9 domain-containing protein, partial [Acidobacteriia bacterium]|nr:carbohydrate binding family 9 domain-containing protein [Terriglobia bacterium]